MPQFAEFLPYIGMGASMLGGIMSGNSSQAASNQEMAGQEAGFNADSAIYNTSMQNLNPFIASGGGALSNLDALLGIHPTATAKLPDFSGIMNTLMNQVKANQPRNQLNQMLDPGNFFGNNTKGLLMSPQIPLLLGSGAPPPVANWFADKIGAPHFSGGKMTGTSGRAMGGPVASGSYVVGEEGPEILHMAPGAHGYVTPNPGTMHRVMEGRAYGGPVTGQNYAGQSPTPHPAVAPAFNPLGSNMTRMSSGQTPAQIMAQQPQYQFTLQQGLNALKSAGLAGGNWLTGGSMKGVMNYAEGLASNTFQNIVNNEANAASLGASAAGMGGQLGSFTGMSLAQLLAAFGNAGASGTAGQANGLSSGLGQVAQIMGMMGGHI